MKKYTDEQLSRILSEHSAGRMRRLGVGEPQHDTDLTWLKDRCVAEVVERRETDNNMIRITGWFDDHYDKKWTADRFLAELEKQGLA